MHTQVKPSPHRLNRQTLPKETLSPEATSQKPSNSKYKPHLHASASSLSDHYAHLLQPIGHSVHILTLRATTRSEGVALVPVVGFLLAFAIVARHATGVVEGLPRFAGDIGAHVPGRGAGEEGEVAEVGDLDDC